MNIRAWESDEENMERNRIENPEIYEKLDEALEDTTPQSTWESDFNDKFIYTNILTTKQIIRELKDYISKEKEESYKQGRLNQDVVMSAVIAQAKAEERGALRKILQEVRLRHDPYDSRGDNVGCAINEVLDEVTTKLCKEDIQ